MTRSRNTESESGTGTTTQGTPDSGTLRTGITVLGRLIGDALILGLWTLFVTLLVLAGGWTGWLYYSLLLGGVVVYVAITVPWAGGRDEQSS